jgi:hypothetical protein
MDRTALLTSLLLVCWIQYQLCGQFRELCKSYRSLFSGEYVRSVRVQLKCDGARWRTRGEVKGKLAYGVGSPYSSHYLGTWCIQHYYHYYL